MGLAGSRYGELVPHAAKHALFPALRDFQHTGLQIGQLNQVPIVQGQVYHSLLIHQVRDGGGCRFDQ